MSHRPRLFRRLITLSTGEISGWQRLRIRETNCLVHWIQIYTVDSVIRYCVHKLHTLKKGEKLKLTLRFIVCFGRGQEICFWDGDRVDHLVRLCSHSTKLKKMRERAHISSFIIHTMIKQLLLLLYSILVYSVYKMYYFCCSMNWPRQAGQQQPYTRKRIYFLSNNCTLSSHLKQVSELNEVGNPV